MGLSLVSIAKSEVLSCRPYACATVYDPSNTACTVSGTFSGLDRKFGKQKRPRVTVNQVPFSKILHRLTPGTEPYRRPKHRRPRGPRTRNSLDSCACGSPSKERDGAGGIESGMEPCQSESGWGMAKPLVMIITFGKAISSSRDQALSGRDGRDGREGQQNRNRVDRVDVLHWTALRQCQGDKRYTALAPKLQTLFCVSQEVSRC